MYRRHNSPEIDSIKECLAKGELGRNTWNSYRNGRLYELEAISEPLTLTMVNNIKISLQPPNLWLADLCGANLAGYDLSDALLAGANLEGAILDGANLSGANLMATNMQRSRISGADLSRANLLDANLSNAQIDGSSLSSAIMLRTNVQGAVIRRSDVHGVSVWGLKGYPADQRDLTITTLGEPLITVDDIEVGQFVYLLLHNPKIRNVIDALTSKVVLILGNFSEDRKIVLDLMRDKLRQYNFSPILFDFEASPNLDISDTVTLLARMARFVIADLSDPRCVQQELSMIAPNVMVPIRPIIIDGQQPWAMFGDLQRRSRGLMPVLKYASVDDLLARMAAEIIAPAEAQRAQLLN